MQIQYLRNPDCLCQDDIGKIGPTDRTEIDVIAAAIRLVFSSLTIESPRRSILAPCTAGSADVCSLHGIADEVASAREPAGTTRQTAEAE
jgi:hypothetical protein